MSFCCQMQVLRPLSGCPLLLGLISDGCEVANSARAVQMEALQASSAAQQQAHQHLLSEREQEHAQLVHRHQGLQAELADAVTHAARAASEQHQEHSRLMAVSEVSDISQAENLCGTICGLWPVPAAEHSLVVGCLQVVEQRLQALNSELQEQLAAATDQVRLSTTQHAHEVIAHMCGISSPM